MLCANNPVRRSDHTGLWFGFDDIFTGPIDEIIVLGGLGILCLFGVEWAINAKDELVQSLNSAWNNFVNSFNSFINSFNPSNQISVNMDEVVDHLGTIAGSHGTFRCREAAKQMMDYLLSKKIGYGVVEIIFPTYPGYIVSVLHNDKVISQNGYHIGVYLNGMVFCNVHPYGLPLQQWIDDFDGFGYKDVRMIL